MKILAIPLPIKLEQRIIFPTTLTTSFPIMISYIGNIKRWDAEHVRIILYPICPFAFIKILSFKLYKTKIGLNSFITYSEWKKHNLICKFSLWSLTINMILWSIKKFNIFNWKSTICTKYKQFHTNESPWLKIGQFPWIFPAFLSFSSLQDLAGIFPHTRRSAKPPAAGRADIVAKVVSVLWPWLPYIFV